MPLVIYLIEDVQDISSDGGVVFNQGVGSRARIRFGAIHQQEG